MTGKKEERTSYIQIISGDRKNSNTYRIIYEILPPLDIFICIGQSNMCGRGYMDESKGDLKPVDNTFLLTPALKWEIASNPFNKYSSVRNDISVQQISPSYGFAHYLSRHIHSKIGMIVNGRGGDIYIRMDKR
ncbi:sialate O-acetylesterase [Bacteroides ovatus]|nr:sialate O-acetylesterase [Bacteroides ovatus]